MATKTTAVASTSARNVASEIAYLARALKAPTLREAVDRLAARAAPRRGAMRSSWRRVCSVRSLPANLMAAKAASGLPAFRPASRWRSSTLTTPAASSATLSRFWAPWTSSPPKTTWCSSDHREPGKPT